VTPADSSPDGGARPMVRGSLDKEVIRSVIRHHLAEVRSCYERELVKDSSLVGRISVQFTIAFMGDVLESLLQSSTMGNPRVEECVVEVGEISNGHLQIRKPLPGFGVKWHPCARSLWSLKLNLAM
jgi:hypothetical protein